MKKSIIIAMTAIAAIAINFVAGAQTPEEIKASDERIAQLIELSQKAPKASKVASVDGLAVDSFNAALYAVKASESLKILQVQPTLEAALVLAEEVEVEVKQLADATKKMEAVTEEVKTIKNPLQIANVTAAMNFSRKALQLVGEESVYQGKAVAAIIEKMKSE